MEEYSPEVLLENPPAITECFPAASLDSPPPTVAAVSLAVLVLPPVMIEKGPDAT